VIRLFENNMCDSICALRRSKSSTQLAQTWISSSATSAFAFKSAATSAEVSPPYALIINAATKVAAQVCLLRGFVNIA